MIEQLESELRSALRTRADELPAGAAPRLRAQAYRPRTRDLRPPVAAGVLTSAAAAAAAVLLIDLGPQAPAAFAGWSAVPTHASRAQVAVAHGDCAASLAQVRGRAAQAASRRASKPPLLSHLQKLATSPVLTDTRGPFTFVVFNSGGANASCISGPGFASVTMRSATQASGPTPAGKVVPSFQIHTARAGDAYTFVEGRAGAGVTAATLVLSDGSHIQATVQNGWLVAWWPGSAQLTSARVTTASGTTTQTFDTRAPADCPAPPPGTPAWSGSTTPAGSTTPSGSTTSSGHVTSRGAICSAVSAAGGSGQAAGSISMGSAAGAAQAPVGGAATSGTGG
jgi:hypothetical protein